MWMEISKDAFRSVGVLTGDASPQSLAPADKLSEQDAICSEHLSSSRLCFVRDGSCSECIKYFNRHFFKPWISNYINYMLLVLIAFSLPKLPPEVSVKRYCTTGP